jgi:hypothetical protein
MGEGTNLPDLLFQSLLICQIQLNKKIILQVCNIL